MNLKQKIETLEYLKGILKKIHRSANNINISNPIFVFDSIEKENMLIKIIADLAIEIHTDENVNSLKNKIL